jgi:ribosomal protein S18 acetylase RimI-like enzyme
MIERMIDRIAGNAAGEPKTLDEAIEAFKKQPLNAFLSHGGVPYVWPAPDDKREGDLATGAIDFQKIYVRIGMHKLGYIHNMEVHGRQATIGHFATATDVEGRGVAQIMARTCARELEKRYGVERIIFDESHKKFYEKGYPRFFSKIGATVVVQSPMPLPPARPQYEWLNANW